MIPPSPSMTGRRRPIRSDLPCLSSVLVWVATGCPLQASLKTVDKSSQCQFEGPVRSGSGTGCALWPSAMDTVQANLLLIESQIQMTILDTTVRPAERC